MSTNRDKRLLNAIRLALGTSLAATMVVGPTALAAEEDDAAELERVQVTGSRLQRTDIETATPVYVLSNEEIKAAGYQRVEDILNSLPQVEAAQNAFISNGSTLTASVDLRGLGPARTLVLFNGRRLPPGGVYTSSPDINQIPAGMIERVEVLTGGGSSVYGADAVAGVINFILRKDFEGIEISANWSGYQHDNSNSYIQGLMDDAGYDYPTGSDIGGEATSLSVVLGGMFADGRGHATAYIDYRKVDAMLQGERDYSSCALNNAGTACGGSSTAPDPNFDIYPINFTDPDTGELVPIYNDPNYTGAANENLWGGLNAGGLFTDTVNIYNYAPVNYFQRPDERYALGAFAGYEINDNVRPYVEVNFFHDQTVAQIAESGTFYAEEYHVGLDNRNVFTQAQADQLAARFGLAPTDQVALYVGKRNVEGGGRQDRGNHTGYRFVLGADGNIGDNWSYDASYLYSATVATTAYVNDFYGPRVREALEIDGPCTDPCVPYEVFTPGGVTEEAAAYVQGTGILSAENTMEVLNAYVTGDLGFAFPTAVSPVAAVFGVERREESFNRVADEVFASALLLGQGGPTQSIQGSYDVNELFTELSLPIIEGAPMAEQLLLELGARYSDYSNFGGENTYKVALDWTPISALKIRGAYNRAIRAPNNGELFQPQGIGLWSGSDPCAGSNPELTQAQCELTGVTPAQYGNVSESPASQYNAIFGGNQNLQPEIADTITFGIVSNPTENFNFSIDYWKVEIEDAIGIIGAETTIRACGTTGEAVFCDLINRGAGGNLWLGQQGYVVDTNINLGEAVWEGVDITAQYNQEIGPGRLNVSMVGTNMLTKDTTPIPSLPETTDECAGIISPACFPSPEWRHTISATYGMDDWSGTLRWRYYGEVDYDGTTDTLVGDGIDAQNYFDVVGQYYLGGNASFMLGVNNILDEEPPMVGGTLATNANTIAGFWDMLGRMIFANVTVSY